MQPLPTLCLFQATKCNFYIHPGPLFCNYLATVSGLATNSNILASNRPQSELHPLFTITLLPVCKISEAASTTSIKINQKKHSDSPMSLSFCLSKRIHQYFFDTLHDYYFYTFFFLYMNNHLFIITTSYLRTATVLNPRSLVSRLVCLLCSVSLANEVCCLDADPLQTSVNARQTKS
jgi:hypothetical protein